MRGLYNVRNSDNVNIGDFFEDPRHVSQRATRPKVTAHSGRIATSIRVTKLGSMRRFHEHTNSVPRLAYRSCD